MNAKQQNAWEDLVQQCEAQITRRPYSSINVASQVRSDAIVAAGKLVELVMPELAGLLERMANRIGDFILPSDYDKEKMEQARTLAAHIREALALEGQEEGK